MTEWMTSREVAARCRVDAWTVVKASRKAGIRAIRRKWQWVYPFGSEMRQAVIDYVNHTAGCADCASYLINQHLNRLLSAFGVGVGHARPQDRS